CHTGSPVVGGSSATITAVILSAASPPLRTVTVWTGAVIPGLRNARTGGRGASSVSTRSMPRPWIVIIACDGPGTIPASEASSTSVSGWSIGRAIVGAYVTLSTKSAPGATVVFVVGSGVTVNAALAPAIFVIELMSSVAVPLLVSLIVCDGGVPSTSIAPKSTVDGTLIPAVIALPVSVTWRSGVRLVRMFTCPLSVPMRLLAWAVTVTSRCSPACRIGAGVGGTGVPFLLTANANSVISVGASGTKSVA